jgi:cell division protein FtsQ
MRVPDLPLRLRPPSRAVVACAAVLVLLAVAWMWLRDSPLVAVRDVEVVGVSGADAPRVRSALSLAARDMTTLHVREGQLATAVAPYPDVASVDAHPDFPHGMRLVVHEHVPVAALVSGSQRVAVAADGTVLRDLPTGGLAVVAGTAPPAGQAIDDGRASRAVALLAAAPPALRAHVTRVTSSARGLTAALRDGPDLYFGDAARLRAKWTAIVRVLADRSSAGATYLDVRLPERPAAGGVEPLQAEEPPSSPQVGVQPAQPETATTPEPITP